jgi:hypothetical protein
MPDKSTQAPASKAGKRGQKAFDGRGVRDEKDRIVLVKLQIISELDGYIKQLAGNDAELRQALGQILSVTKGDLKVLGGRHYQKRLNENEPKAVKHEVKPDGPVQEPAKV